MSFSLLVISLYSYSFKWNFIKKNNIGHVFSFSMQAVGQRIMVECVECELALTKHNIKDYTKSSVEVLFLNLVLDSCLFSV